MLLSGRQVFRMAEAIPAAALPLLEALGLGDLVRQIGVPINGLETWLDGQNSFHRDDLFLLIDRAEFAKRMLDAAILRGAATEVIGRLPGLTHRDERRVCLAGAGRVQEFEAAIDATGRAALWSRPLNRRPTRLAHVFQSPPMSSPAGLKLVQYESGWAYRIGLQKYMTSVLISCRTRSPELRESLARTFGTSSGVSTLIGRRLASVQWAACPIQHRTIAVGDAALAQDPISGQGIRFALASALAAASVIRTWCGSSSNEDLASNFYSEFVATELSRHLSFVDSFYEASSQLLNGGTNISTEPKELHVSPHDKVYFSGRVEIAPLHVGGIIASGQVIRLGDGGSVRWLSGFDLLRLRTLTEPAATVACLRELLDREGLEQRRAAAIIDWCIKNEILVKLPPKV
jgi:flavin-dependent dehydrogenase